jgi:hypothetical protein
MKKKKFYYILCLINICGENQITNKINNSFKKIEEKVSRFASKTKEEEKKIISGIKDLANKTENKIEEKFYEEGIFEKDNMVYVPLIKETILIYLKKNSINSLLTNPKILDLHLNNLYSIIPYLPLPDFKTAVKNDEEEMFNFINKFGGGYHNILKSLSLVSAGVLLVSVIYEQQNNISSNHHVSINGATLLMLMVFFPSKIFYLDFKIEILYYILHMGLLGNNGYYFYNIVKDNGWFNKDYINSNILMVTNILFAVYDILYVNYYPYEYNKLKKKVEKLHIITKKTIVSTLTENPNDDYAIPAGNIDYLYNI